MHWWLGLSKQTTVLCDVRVSRCYRVVVNVVSSTEILNVYASRRRIIALATYQLPATVTGSS